MSDEELIAELQRRRPDLIVLPREPKWIMGLRGYQANRVFMDHEFDLALDYLKFEDIPQLEGVDDGTNDWLREDQRLYFIIAAIYRGCISGFIEWSNRDESDPVFRWWDRPMGLPKIKE